MCASWAEPPATISGLLLLEGLSRRDVVCACVRVHVRVVIVGVCMSDVFFVHKKKNVTFFLLHLAGGIIS